MYDLSPALGLDVTFVFLLPRYRQIKLLGHTSPVPSKVSGGCWGSIPIYLSLTGGRANEAPGSRAGEFGTAHGASAAPQQRLLLCPSHSTLPTKPCDREQFTTIARNVLFQSATIFAVHGFRAFWGRNPESRSPQRTFRCLNAPSACSAATATRESCAALSLL